jgi:hypothetical protein
LLLPENSYDTHVVEMVLIVHCEGCGEGEAWRTNG